MTQHDRARHEQAGAAGASEDTTARLRRREAFLRERAEAQQLRERVAPRRARVLRLRRSWRLGTFRR